MICETYRTEGECARKFADENFDSFPAYRLFDKIDSWDDAWEFVGNVIEEDVEDDDGAVSFGLTHEPDCGVWFIPNGFMAQWIKDHMQEVADCGFTLINDGDDGELFALGIDGGGYSFLHEHWIPLYRAFGCHWHDEE
jgi:hypothetical protein